MTIIFDEKMIHLILILVILSSLKALSAEIMYERRKTKTKYDPMVAVAKIVCSLAKTEDVPEIKATQIGNEI